MCNVAWKRFRAGDITTEHATLAVAEVGRMFDELRPMAALAPRALEIARVLDHPAYDCFYLALAEAEDTHLLTADEVLLRRVAGTPWARRVRPLVSRPARR